MLLSFACCSIWGLSFLLFFIFFLLLVSCNSGPWLFLCFFVIALTCAADLLVFILVFSCFNYLVAYFAAGLLFVVVNCLSNCFYVCLVVFNDFI